MRGISSHAWPGEQAVRLRVVDLAARNGTRERLEVLGIHLVVAGHHADDVDLLLERALVAGDDRGADAAVALVDDELDARVAERAHALRRRVGRAVVDDDDPVDEARDAAERRRDQVLLVVRGHDDRDALALEHRYSPRRRDMPAATPSHMSATIAPMMRPISAATTTVFRRLRAVIFCAVAPVRICGASTCVAWSSSWLVLS